MDLKKLIYKQALHLKRITLKREESPYIFHASEAGKCIRSLVQNRRGKFPDREPLPLTKQAELEMLFNDGRMHQRAITEYLFQAPGVHITSIEETKVMHLANPDNSISIVIVGHPDGVVYETKLKERWIVEIKGLNHFACQKLKDGDVDTLKSVYYHAIPQSRMYSRMFDTKGAVILVKNKNTSVIYQFIIPRDEEAELRIIAKFIRVAQTCKDNLDMPSCDWTKGDRNTNFCDYPNDCGVGR